MVELTVEQFFDRYDDICDKLDNIQYSDVKVVQAAYKLRISQEEKLQRRLALQQDTDNTPIGEYISINKSCHKYRYSNASAKKIIGRRLEATGATYRYDYGKGFFIIARQH